MKKILPICLIGLLILCGCGAGTQVLPEGSSETKPVTNCNMYDDDLDQYMTETLIGYGFPVGTMIFENVTFKFQVAQSFIPQREVLTRVQVYVGRNSSATQDFILAIRDNISGENLAEITVDVEEFVIENFSWVEIEFDDIAVTVGETYYIVAYTADVADNWYGWGGNPDNFYLDGCAWLSLDDGPWTNDSYSSENQKHDWLAQNQVQTSRVNDTWDMCFMTFGRDNLAPDSLEIDGPAEGVAGEEYTFSFIATDPENEGVEIYVDWGDNTTMQWHGPYNSGEEAFIKHTWDDIGDYVIKAKAKDASGHETDWVEYIVTMPRDKSPTSLQKTFVWGQIRFLRMRDNSITFRAVKVHYRIFGEGLSGVYKHQRLTFDNNYIGSLRTHWVCAIFDGTPV